MKKRNKEEVLSGQRIKIAALLMGISLLLLSGCGNKAQEAEESQVQTDIAVTATEQTAAAEEQSRQRQQIRKHWIMHTGCISRSIPNSGYIWISSQR